MKKVIIGTKTLGSGEKNAASKQDYRRLSLSEQG
jgi:hypothetical protein